MIGIIGHKTTVAQALCSVISASPRNEEIHTARLEAMPFDLPRYLIAMGYLCGEPIADQTPAEQNGAWQDNFVQIATFCDTVFASNPFARICILGSASGDRGSYDVAYSGSKAAIHHYIKTKRLSDPGQQLVGIAPWVVEDSGMTQRRNDLDACLQRGKKQRRGQWIKAAEVAELAHFLLYVDRGAICNEVIGMTGGIE